MSWPRIATALRAQYGMNSRVAMRLAHGWTQSDAAEAWNRRWPETLKTFKNFSYWENWPGATGHQPSLTTLNRLAELYSCTVADLLADWGEHRDVGESHAPATGDAEVETAALAWRLEHLGQSELARVLLGWSRRVSEDQRGPLLLKISAAAALAANGVAERMPAALGPGPRLEELAGAWDSSYSYFSTGRSVELIGEHNLVLSAQNGKLIGRSSPTDTGTVELELSVDGLLISGTWTELTAQSGYYGGAVYRGILQLVLDPVGRSMSGQWLGPDKNFAINSGSWRLTRSCV